jgi:glycosyltransferase involved in cell wall biosynthesis
MSTSNPLPLVSVIIPAYGHAEFILQTIDSVLSQTFQDYEIIVVNDGSPDRTAEVLQPLIKKGLVHYIEQVNSGVAVARNTGLSHSMGKYIAFLDDDDIWPSNKLEWQVKIMETCELVAVGGVTGLVGSEGQLIPPTEAGEKPRLLDFEELFRGNPFLSPGQVLIDRSAIIAIGGFDSSIWGVDDLDAWVGLARIGRFEIRGELALYYRVHETNASRNYVRMIMNCKKVVEKRLLGLVRPQVVRCRRDANRWMFNYLGGRLLGHAFGCPGPRPGWKKSIYLSCIFVRVFGLPFLSDCLLRRQILGWIRINLFCSKKSYGFGSETPT